jgi:hypothetical protein
MTNVSTEGSPEVASPANVTPTASAIAQEHTEEKAAASTNPTPTETQLKPEVAENNDEDSDFDDLDGTYPPPSLPRTQITDHPRGTPILTPIQTFSMISPSPNPNHHLNQHKHQPYSLHRMPQQVSHHRTLTKMPSSNSSNKTWPI